MSNLYVRITHQGSSSHGSKDSPLWGSLIKDYKIYTIIFTIISTFFFSKGFIFTYDIFISLDPTNNMKLLNANYEPKAPISTPYILERKK
jgi:hypothetical protein